VLGGACTVARERVKWVLFFFLLPFPFSHPFLFFSGARRWLAAAEEVREEDDRAGEARRVFEVYRRRGVGAPAPSTSRG